MLLSQDTVNLVPPSEFSNLSNLSFQSLISISINFILIIAAIILFFILIGGGLAVMLSGGGNTQGASRGRSAVTAAVIGLIIVFGAWAIITLIESFFGVSIIHLNLPG